MLIKGTVASLVTPFNDDDSVNYAELARYALNAVDGGMDVACFGGGTGEINSLTDEEFERSIKAIDDALGSRAPIIAGALGTNPKDVVKRSEIAKSAGADCIMIIAPYFYHPSQEQVYRHFTYVAENSALPVLLFNSQGRSGLDLEASVVIRLAAEQKNIVGIKEASGVVRRVGDIVQAVRGDFAVIQAWDQLVLPSFILGSVGSFGSLGNFMPRTLSHLHRLMNEGDFAEARNVHAKIVKVADLVYSEPIPNGVKLVMEFMGLRPGGVRAPLSATTTPDKTAQLKEIAAFCTAMEAEYK